MRLHGLLKQNFAEIKATHKPIQNYTAISAFRKNPSLRDILVKAAFSLDKPIEQEHQDRFFPQTYISNPYSKRGAAIYQSFTLTTTNIIYTNHL